MIVRAFRLQAPFGAGDNSGGEDLLELPHKYSVLIVEEEMVVCLLSACEPSVSTSLSL
jgi:hypothetical protein